MPDLWQILINANIKQIVFTLTHCTSCSTGFPGGMRPGMGVPGNYGMSGGAGHPSGAQMNPGMRQPGMYPNHLSGGGMPPVGFPGAAGMGPGSHGAGGNGAQGQRGGFPNGGPGYFPNGPG